MNTKQLILQRVQESLQVKQHILESPELIEKIHKAANLVLACYKMNQGCLFFAGNGGSAADAQHLAAEMVGRFQLERRALSAEALNVNSSTLTSVANDYGYEHVFERAIEAKGKKGDVFVGISTSGKSQTIILAMQKCKEIGITTIGMTGMKEAPMDAFSDVCIKVPAEITARIQEAHILIGHILCEIVEQELFGNA